MTLPVRLVTVSGPGAIADLFAILFASTPKASLAGGPVSAGSGPSSRRLERPYRQE